MPKRTIKQCGCSKTATQLRYTKHWNQCYAKCPIIMQHESKQKKLVALLKCYKIVHNEMLISWLFLKFQQYRNEYYWVTSFWNWAWVLKPTTRFLVYKVYWKLHVPSKLTLTGSLKPCLTKQMILMMFVTVPKMSTSSQTMAKQTHWNTRRTW